MAQAPIAAGTRIAGRYVVHRLLGEGGMGQVFEVINEAVDRRFALKLLRIDPLTESALGRFRREAKAVGRLASSRVVQVIDSGVDDHVGPYMVMELLAGETLDRRLARDLRLPWQEAVHLAASLCDALADVHASGVVHRDLKPSNVGLPHDGPIEVKLLDFGLAASMVEGAFTEKLTQSQQLIGTLPYMAPEQFHNAPVTSAVDLYAVGIILFEMLAGRRPFVATSVAAYVQMHLFEPPPTIAEVAPDVQIPGWLDSLVLQLLCKEVQDRPTSAAEVAELLRQHGAQEVDRAYRPTAKAWVGSRDIPSPVPDQHTPLASTAVLLRTPKVVVRPPPIEDVNDTISDLRPAGITPGWKRLLWPVVALAATALALVAWQLRAPSKPAPPVAAAPQPVAPAAAQPAAPQPVAAQPVAAQPVAAQPVAAQPVAAQPVAAQPVAAQPVAAPRPNASPPSTAAPIRKPTRPQSEKRGTLPAAPGAAAGESKSTWKGEVITDPE